MVLLDLDVKLALNTGDSPISNIFSLILSMRNYMTCYKFYIPKWWTYLIHQHFTWEAMK